MHRTAVSATPLIQSFSLARPCILAGVVLLVFCAADCKGQVPAAVSEAIDRSDSAKEKALSAFNRNDYQTALVEIEKCVGSLRKAESLATDPEMKTFLQSFVASETNRTILFCFTGVDNSEISAGISNEWRKTIEKLDPPQEVKELADPAMVTLDWPVYLAFGSLQQHLADYYIRKKDYSRANWHFAFAETYFEKYEERAPKNILSDPEQNRIDGAC